MGKFIEVVKIVWKKEKQQTEEQVRYISKKAVKKKFSPMFIKGHTRKGRELNQSMNCKNVVEKKVK